VFCQKPGSSREDVFALWISSLLEKGTPFTLTNSHGRNKDGLKKLGVYTRDVCRSCNNEWMSRLENKTKPLISSAILGQPTKWDVSEQETIAAWAFKTALMLDRSSIAAMKVRPEHFDFLWRQGVPPGSVRIAVAFYRPDDGEALHGFTAGVGVGEPSIEGAYRIVFSVGHLVFQIHGHAGIDDRGVSVDLWAPSARSGLWIPLSNTFLPLWRSSGHELEWPTSTGFALNTGSLLALGTQPITRLGTDPATIAAAAA